MFAVVIPSMSASDSLSVVATFLTNIKFEDALKDRTSEEFSNMEQQITRVVSFMMVVFDIYINQRQS